MGKYYIVFSKRLAKTLVKMGYEIKQTAPNKLRPNYSVYMFDNTDEIRRAIEQAIGKNHQRFSQDI